MENLGDYRARLLVVLAMLISVDLIDGARTYAVANDNDGGFRAVPAVFVGTAPGCAPSPSGSNIVTSAWLPGMGSWMQHVIAAGSQAEHLPKAAVTAATVATVAVAAIVIPARPVPIPLRPERNA